MNKKIIWAAYFSIMIFGMAMLSLGSVNNYLVQIQNLSQDAIAKNAILISSGILLGSLFFGPIVDRLGYKIILTISTLFIGISFFVISATSQIILQQTSFFIIGFAGGAINGSTSALVSDVSETNKSANLSILGVFYGIGALGTPLLIGLLSRHFSIQSILFSFSIVTLFPILYALFVEFPEPKQKQGFPIVQGLSLFKNPLILLLGFFLFFQSGIEGITNNWTTSFLRETSDITPERALYALSIVVVALTISRLLLSGLLKKISSFTVLFCSLCLILTSCIILYLFHSQIAIFIGFSMLGFGFAAGFPVILGLVGELYPSISGTAFSVILFIALVGNTAFNYFIGWMATSNMITYFPVVIGTSVILMLGLFLGILHQLKSRNVN